MIQDRRQFLSRLAAFCAAAGLPVFALADDDERRGTSRTPAPTLPVTGLSGRVAVVGGGMAGAAVAKFLRLWGGAGVQVTLVEREAAYNSNILSNLVLTNTVAMSSLVFDYARLSSAYGINVLRGEAIAADPVAGRLTVATASGPRVVDYDRLVVAPGIEFDYPEGLKTADAQSRFPHAWKAGPQTTQLRDQIRAMPAGGTFVMTVPPSPYRCPPGPYERACVVADYLKRNKPGAQVVVLDANAGIMAEKESFGHAFTTLYGSNLTYRPGRVVKSVAAIAGRPEGSVVVDVVVTDALGQTVVMGSETYEAQLLNVIPPHRAGPIAQSVGVVDATGFAPVDGRSFESTVAGKAGIHVIGDASKTTLPKAGHVANQEGKICADAILRAFSGQSAYATPTANSACFSPVSSTLASWLTAVYQYQQDPVTGSWKYVAMDQVSGAAGATEAQAASTGSFSKMNTWYRSLMAETYA